MPNALQNFRISGEHMSVREQIKLHIIHVHIKKICCIAGIVRWSIFVHFRDRLDERLSDIGVEAAIRDLQRSTT